MELYIDNIWVLSKQVILTFEFLSTELLQVCRDPRWGRCYESYSEDHKVVQEMTEIIPGLQGDVPVNYSKGAPYVSEK